MAFLLKDTVHRSLVETLYNEFLSRRANYFYYIGKVIDWADTNTPETPLNTAAYEYDTRNNIIGVKKINIRDVSLVIPRRDWVPGIVYDQYDPDYSETNPAASGAIKLKDATFYVLTSTFGVYKCIFNNNGVPSTVEPSGLDPIPVTYSDGYIWKYLYTIPLSSRNRFLTDTFMPVQRAVTNKFYSNGEVGSIVIESQGSGYRNNSYVNLSVVGTFNNTGSNVNATLKPILNPQGQIVDVHITNPGNNYKTATVRVIDSLTTGNSYYKGVSNAHVVATGTGYTTAIQNNTTVTLVTTGAVQPTSNAILSPVFASNVLVGIDVLNAGSGYTTPVKANTTVVITTSGNTQPSVAATGTVSYVTGAVLKPVLMNGRIDRVLIEDPGIGYSANNETFISTIGDGEGVVLTPVISDSGELEDVIIEQRGVGYTYLDVEVLGEGSGANVYANLYDGDLNTIQGIIELSSIDGINAINITDGGDGYSTANVTVIGDGNGFIGNVVLTNNAVTSVTVVSPGYGYTYANVIINGDGANATAKAIISPYGGHGRDPVAELFADTIMLYSTINNEKNQGVSVNNDYRQFGIIKDIKEAETERAFTSALGSACYLLTLSTVTGLAQDSILQLDGKSFEVVEVVPDVNRVLITNKNNHEIEAEDNLMDVATGVNYTVQEVVATPDINKFSGDLLFIDNRTTVSYSDQQLVTLRTVIRV